MPTVKTVQPKPLEFFFLRLVVSSDDIATVLLGFVSRFIGFMELSLFWLPGIPFSWPASGVTSLVCSVSCSSGGLTLWQCV